MRYLKTFENFDFGDRFSGQDSDEQDWMSNKAEYNSEEELEDDDCETCEEEEEEEEELEDTPRVWGDEVVEKKKVNAGLQAYLDKQKAKKGDKKEDKEEKGGKKAKPDFLDLDKDGNKKESMKKAAKDAKEEKGGKGLTAAQKKLPEGLRKAIEAKAKKK